METDQLPAPETVPAKSRTHRQTGERGSPRGLSLGVLLAENEQIRDKLSLLRIAQTTYS